MPSPGCTLLPAPRTRDSPSSAPFERPNSTRCRPEFEVGFGFKPDAAPNPAVAEQRTTPWRKRSVYRYSGARGGGASEAEEEAGAGAEAEGRSAWTLRQAAGSAALLGASSRACRGAGERWAHVCGVGGYCREGMYVAGSGGLLQGLQVQ